MVRRHDIDERKEEILEWVTQSIPKQEIARRLHCKPLTLNSRLKEWGLSNYSRQGWSLGRSGLEIRHYIEVAKYLELNGKLISTSKLKKKLIRENLKPNKCEICDWETLSVDNRSILELDHINGNRFDNRLENLLLLCPNCHASKPGGNIGLCCERHMLEWWNLAYTIDLGSIAFTEACEFESRFEHPSKPIHICPICTHYKSVSSIHCRKCSNSFRDRPTKINWPSTEVLIEMIEDSNYLAVGKQLGVSDNAVRKRIRNHA